MISLKEYKKIEEKDETLISIIIYDKKNEDVQKFMKDQLEKAKKINNSIKKNKINNRLFLFIKFLSDNYLENFIINSIFLLNDKIIEHKLNKDEINTAKTYNLINIFIKSDIFFYVDYFIDLFYNFNFIYTIKINKNDVNVIKMNKNKDKELENYKISNEQKIIEIIENIRKNNYKDLIIIYGNSNFIMKIDNYNIKNILILKDFLNKEELFNLYENELMKKNHLLLKEQLDKILNEKSNLDLFLFGKLKNEIKDAIESYSIKELYIDENKIYKLKSLVDESYFNFKIIPIRSLENSDIAFNFIKDYNGIMAIKYY